MNRDGTSRTSGKVVSRETRLPGWAWPHGLALASLLPLVALILLFLFNVPLGKPGKFLHLYSLLTLRRVYSVPAAAGLVFVQVCGIWLLSACERRAINGGALHSPPRGAAGLAWAMILAATAGLGAWAWYAPPDHLSQHAFNLASPSHDGAFAVEGWRMADLRAYLRDFPRYVVSPEARWGGTRIMSNPPGLTMLSCGLREVHRAAPNLTNRMLPTDQMPDDPAVRETMSVCLLLGIVLHWIWGLAVVPWYFAARLWLSRSESAAIAICCVFTPATLMFTPGKDPAQLFTVGLLAWLWFGAILRGSVVAALALGVVIVVGLLLSLVHVWVMVVLGAASVVALIRGIGRPLPYGRGSDGNGRGSDGDGRGSERVGLRGLRLAWVVGVATLGMGVAALGLWWVSGYEAWRAVPAIAQGQTTVTRGADAMPFWWQALGVPLFMVLCGPAVWWFGVATAMARAGRENEDRFLTGAALKEDAAAARFGSALVGASIVVMLATVGFTNVETPRLWMPFAALVVLGGGVVAFGGARGRRPVALAALIVAAQLAGSVGQWTLMDMREAENRLSGAKPVLFGE